MVRAKALWFLHSTLKINPQRCGLKSRSVVLMRQRLDAKISAAKSGEVLLDRVKCCRVCHSPRRLFGQCPTFRTAYPNFRTLSDFSDKLSDFSDRLSEFSDSVREIGQTILKERRTRRDKTNERWPIRRAIKIRPNTTPA